MIVIMFFLSYLQILELDLNFVAVWKLKFKDLKVGEMFLQIFGFFFKHFNIDVMNILIHFVNLVCLIKIITNPKKWGDIFGELKLYFQP
jgi:hypothetical protein